MFIKEVISHKNAWENLRNNHYELYEDIIHGIKFDINSIDLDIKEIKDRYYSVHDRTSLFHTVRYYTEANLKNKKWDMMWF